MVVIKSDEYPNIILNLPRKRNCLQDLLKSDFTVHGELNFSGKRVICDILNNCEGMIFYLSDKYVYMYISSSVE